MLDKIFGISCYIFFFIVFHHICRMSSSYFPKSRCKKYIVIKNRILVRLLIADGIARDKFVDRCDLNKMSIVGLISYIAIEPVNLYILIIAIMDHIKFGNVDLGSLYNVMAYGILGILLFLFIIIETINNSRCCKR